MLERSNIQYPEFQGQFWADLDALGWSQRKLARKVGVTPATVTAWKQGGIPEYAKNLVKAAISARNHWLEFDA